MKKNNQIFVQSMVVQGRTAVISGKTKTKKTVSRFFSIIMAALLLFSFGQQANAYNCGWGGSNYSSINVSGWVIGSSGSVGCTAGNYVTISNTVVGVTYQITTCGGASWDTELQAFNSSTGSLGYVDDNGPGGCGLQGGMQFTATTTTSYVRLTRYNCNYDGSYATIYVSRPCTAASTPSVSFYPNNTSQLTASWGTSSGTAPITYDYSFNGAAYVSNGSSNSVSFSGLTANTQYSLVVRANGCTGAVYSGTIYAKTFPADPTSITRTGDATICSGSSTTLTANGAQGTVYWYTGSCGGTYIGSGNSIAVAPTSNTTYYARNNNGNWSSGCASLTVNSFSPFVAPSSPIASATGSQTADLSWSASTGGSGTITYYWAVGTSTGVTYGSGTANGSTTTLATAATGLAQSTTYYLRVYANNSCGNTVYVTSSSFRTHSVLSYTAGANGSISGTASQTVANTASGSAVTAVPNANYHFVNWSDGSTTNPRTDTNVTSSISVTANFAINILEFSVQPTSTIAGDNMVLSVRIKDRYGNTMTNSDQDITLAIETNPSAGTLTGTTITTVNGVASTSENWIDKVGTGYKLTATASPLTGATSGAFNITPAAIDHFTVSGITDPVVAGTTTTPVVTAYDQYENVKTNYTGTIQFSSAETHHAEEVLPAYTFLSTDLGVKSLINGVTLKTTGERTVTVTDGSATGSQTAITVTPADINNWGLVVNGPLTAGVAFTVTATVYDQYGNVKTNYEGENSVSWSTTAISSPNNTPRVIPVNGIQNFTAGVVTVGGFIFYNSAPATLPTITVTDGPTAIAGTTDGITVANNIIDNFKVESGTGTLGSFSPTTTMYAGTPFSLRVTARDIYWNTVTDYAGLVRFKTSDDAIFPDLIGVHFPANYDYSAEELGIHVFENLTYIHETGAYWIRVGEGVNLEKSGIQEGIIVGPGAFDAGTSTLELNPTSPLTRVAGEFADVVFIPRDASGNLLCVADGAKTIKLTDSGATNSEIDNIGNIPEVILKDANLMATGSFSAHVRLTKTGTNTITAWYGETKITTEIEMTVSPAPADLAHTTITPFIGSITTDEHTTITVQLKDEFDNDRTTDDGVVTLTTSLGGFANNSGTKTLIADYNGSGSYITSLYAFTDGVNGTGTANITGSIDFTDGANPDGAITPYTTSVAILEGLPDLTTSTISADPGTITTNGTSDITVQLKDFLGNLITNERGSVTLAVSPNGAVITPAIFSAGAYQSTLSGDFPGSGLTTIPGSFEGTGSASTVTGAFTDDASVTFNEGLPNLSQIEITALPTTMTSDESSVITVQLKDIYGNLLTTSRGTVTLSSDKGALTAVTDHADGTYTATLSGDNRGFGDATITGHFVDVTDAIDGDIIDNAVVTITEGKPDLAVISTSSTLASMTTDQTSLIMVQLKDQFSNNLTTSRGTVTLTTSLTGTALTSVTDNTNGTYTATLSTTVTGETTITGSLDDVDDLVSGSITDNAVVSITDGKPALAQIQVTASPISITTDETSTITVQLRDQWGNNLSSQRGTVVLTAVSKGSISSANYVSDGYYTATISGDDRGVGLTSITGVLTDVADELTGTITNYAEVTFTEGLPGLAISDISVDNATITTDGTSTISVQLKDQFGNLIVNNRGTVSLASTIGLVSSVTYVEAGIYTATLTGDTRGTNGTGAATISGTFAGAGSASGVNGSFTDGASVTINEGLPSLATTDISASPTTMTTDETSLITVQLKDQFGNLIVNNRSTVELSTNLGVLSGNGVYAGAGTYTAVLHGNSSGVGTATITGTLAGDVVGSISDNTSVTITEGLPALATCLITADPTTMTTDETSLVTVQLKDQFGNLIVNDRSTVALSTTKGVLTENGVYAGSGTYTATLHGNSSGVGTATITGTLAGDVVGDIADNTTTVEITEGLPALATSLIMASPITMTTDETSLITVQLKDQFGNLIVNNRSIVTLYTDLGVLTGNGEYAGAGIYTATLHGNDTGTGTATIIGTLAGSVEGDIFDNTTTVEITEGLPVLSQIEITANPTSITADETSTITIQLKDQFGNSLVASRGTVTLGTSPIGDLGTVADNDNGTYTATFSLIAYGTGVATISGNFAGTGTAVGVNGAVNDNATVTVAHGVATKLTVLTQPSTTATAGVVFVQQPVVRIEDQFGNLVASDNTTVVTAARATGTATLLSSGDLTATASSGIVSFSGLKYTKAETITLGFSSGSLTGTTSGNILVSPAPTHHLVLNAPSDITAGGTRAAYTVTRYDEFDNLRLAGVQTVYLYSNSTGANKKFYTASSGGSIITSLTIADGTSASNFWYYDEKTSWFGTDGLGFDLAWTITASDQGTYGIDTGIIDATDEIKVGCTSLAVAPNSFLIESPGDTYLFGDPQTIVVKALDTYGNVKTNYNGTIKFSNTDLAAINPADNQTYVVTDYGSKTFPNGLIFSAISTPPHWWLTVLNSAGTYYGGKTFVVNPRPITITANDQSKTYGDTKVLGTTEFTVTSTNSLTPILKAGESVTSVTLASAGAVNTANAGDYAITTSNAAGTGGFITSNYDITYATSGNLMVDLKTLTVTAVAATKIYDGDLTSSGSPTVGTIATTDHIGTAPHQTYDNQNVGSTHVLTPSGLVVLNGADAVVTSNYDITWATVETGEITKKALSVTAPLIASKYYDGNATAGAVTVGTLSGFIGSETVTATAVAANYSSANADTYNNVVVTYTLADGINGGHAANYSLDTGTATGIVTQKALSVTAPSIASRDYNATTTAGAVTVGTLSGFIGSETVTATALAADYSSANANTYNGVVVTYTLHDVTGDNAGLAANYSLATGTATGIVTQKALSVTAPSIASRDYNATTTAGDVTVGTLSGFIPDETVTATAVAANYSSANADTYNDVVVTYTLADGTNGGLAANYSLATGTATGIVTQKALSVTAPSIASRDYNAMTTAGDVTVGTLSGFIPDETVTATAVAADYTSANVGTYEENVVTYTLHDGTGGGLAGNYSLANGTATGIINLLHLDVTAVTTTKIYDGGMTSLGEPTVGTLPLGDVVNAAPTQVYDNKNVGTTHMMTPSGLTIKDGSDANMTANYDIHYNTVLTGEITPRTLHLTNFTAGDKTYDQNTSVVLESQGFDDDRVSGDDITFTWTSATFENENVSVVDNVVVNKVVNYTNIAISGVGVDNGNYTLASTSGTASAKINKRLLTLADFAANDKEYDGTIDVVFAPAFTDDRLSGDLLVFSGTAQFDNKNVGTTHVVTYSGITITGGADKNNYYLELNGGATGPVVEIAARTLTLSATGVNKEYDGTDAATVTFTDNKVLGDNYTVNYTATFADKNVGDGKLVSVSGISLSGTDALNYSYAATASVYANITIKTITIIPDPGQSKLVGESDPTFTYTYSPELYSGDSFSGALGRNPGTDPNAGNYSYTLGDLSAGPNYMLVMTESPATFAILRTSQTLSLIAGWNIISSAVIPVSPDDDMLTVFNPLISPTTKLRKVMDESAMFVEDWTVQDASGWHNTIGNLTSTEGYRVNVLEACELTISGNSVSLPLDIPLIAGWNIISYPASADQNALTAVQALIDAGTLVKVMDESGFAIEDWTSYGFGWVNNIGDFKPGKGYLVKVNAPCALTINEVLNKAATVTPEVIASTHFKTVFTGNGVDHMNINLMELNKSGIRQGDEIGVFDGTTCVGAVTIGADQMSSGTISIPVSANDGLSQTVNGYASGNLISLKFYGNGIELQLKTEVLKNALSIFRKGESTFMKISTLATDLHDLRQNLDVKFYPNPFTDVLSIEINSSGEKPIDIMIYDVMGRKIRTLYNGSGISSLIIKWDGTSDGGSVVRPGIYYMRCNGITFNGIIKR